MPQGSLAIAVGDQARGQLLAKIVNDLPVIRRQGHVNRPRLISCADGVTATARLRWQPPFAGLQPPLRPTSRLGGRVRESAAT
jgi:hypothetical protein